MWYIAVCELRDFAFGILLYVVAWILLTRISLQHLTESASVYIFITLVYMAGPSLTDSFLLTWTVTVLLNLFLSLLLAELDPFLLSSSAHLLWVQRIVLVTFHPIVILPRARHSVWSETYNFKCYHAHICRTYYWHMTRHHFCSGLARGEGNISTHFRPKTFLGIFINLYNGLQTIYEKWTVVHFVEGARLFIYNRRGQRFLSVFLVWQGWLEMTVVWG